ncbi:MAG: ribonuclease III [Methylococcales bacterium]|nr:ribonuclease III [Methylococcales bacterium]MDD5755040.1 ribonuclease III [Methylococcales bacterium]
MTKKPEVLSRKLGLVFNDPQLFIRALTHRSVSANNNERLEFLGDAILGFVIAEQLYNLFPQAPEGVLSRLRASLVNQRSLAELARQHNLGDYLLLGSGELKSGGFRRDSILSDAVEAIIAALFQDQGMAACQKWVAELFAEKLKNSSLNSGQKDPKTRLQELMQAKQLDLPQYELLTASGLAHEQTFKVQCKISLLPTPSIGSGVTRKGAEQSAAEILLELLAKEYKI